MYPEQPDFETPYVFSIDNTAGDTPMTEIREPTVEEKIAAAVLQGIKDTWEKGDQALTLEITRAILALPEIKEGQELREKAKSGKLVELDENQSWPSDPFYPIDTFRIRNYNQLCENSGFRRVKG